jgi:hypothetical protein
MPTLRATRTQQSAQRRAIITFILATVSCNSRSASQAHVIPEQPAQQIAALGDREADRERELGAERAVIHRGGLPANREPL